jgi:hypothetical protein
MGNINGMGTFKKSGIPILPHGLRGIWGKPWFQDFSHGSDGNGESPDKPYQYLDTLITQKVGRDDVIYIRPADADNVGGDPGKIQPSTTSNYVIPRGDTYEGLTLIGTHPGSIAKGRAGHHSHRVYLTSHASGAASKPVLEVRTPYVTLENLAFGHHTTAITSGGGQLYVHGGVSGSYEAFGTTIYNCMFRFAEAGADSGAIYNLDSWYMDVLDCLFYRCEEGINMYGSNSTVRGLCASGNLFQGIANERACDICINGSGSTYIDIYDNRFGLDPADTGSSNGDGYYIYIASGTGVTIQGNHFSDADAAADVSIGDGVDGGNIDGGGWVA